MPSPGSTACPAEQYPVLPRDHQLEDGHKTSRACSNSGKREVSVLFAECKALPLQLNLYGAVLESIFCFSKGDREQRLVPSTAFWELCIRQL